MEMEGFGLGVLVKFSAYTRPVPEQEQPGCVGELREV